MTDPKPLEVCPDCGHDWDRHTGSCHYIGDCSGRECGCQNKPEVAAPLPEPTSRPRPWNAHQRTNERLASELSEATLIIRGFLVFPEMTMDQRKDCIDDARKFLKTLLD